MGQGREHKTRDDAQVEIQERGEIFFFYRPKVNKPEAHRVDDAQRLCIVLRPESSERLVEEKQDPQSGEEGAKEKSNQGQSGSGKNEYEGGKGRQEYDTSTRGHRRNFPARAVGEGVYRILRHNSGKKKMHTHLIYKIEFPPEDEENEPQESLNIKREGSFVIQIKNPEQPGKSQFRGLQKKRKAAFPAHLQGQLGQNRYHPADPPDFLNYEGCEFLLISTRSWVWNLRPKGKQIHLVQIWSGLSGRLHLQLPFSRAFGLE
ncbi:hypothetical protein QUC31_011985 [Theobroma cacao]